MPRPAASGGDGSGPEPSPAPPPLHGGRSGAGGVCRRQLESCEGKHGSPRTLPLVEPAELPAGGSPGWAAPAKAGNSAMAGPPPPPPERPEQDGGAAQSVLGAVVLPPAAKMAAEGRRSALGPLSVGLRPSCALRRRSAGLEQGTAAGKGGMQFADPALPAHYRHPSWSSPGLNTRARSSGGWNSLLCKRWRCKGPGGLSVGNQCALAASARPREQRSSCSRAFLRLLTGESPSMSDSIHDKQLEELTSPLRSLSSAFCILPI